MLLVSLEGFVEDARVLLSALNRLDTFQVCDVAGQVGSGLELGPVN